MENESTENEHKMKAVIAIVAVLLIAILLFVGKYIFPDIDGTINAIVKNSNDAFTQLNNPEVIDARSYRDGKNNGVVLEYTFSKKKSEEKIDAVLRKQKLIENLKIVTDNFHIYTFGGLKETNKWLTKNKYA